MRYRALVYRSIIFMTLMAATFASGQTVFAQAQGTVRIVYYNGISGGDLYSMNFDGTGVTRLTHDGMSGLPACAGSGKIAFPVTRAGNTDIYVMNWDGTNQTRVTTNTSEDNFPAWSPDGRKIVFSRYEPASGHQLWVINADGTGETRLTSPSTRDSYQPSWSPDGTKIAFNSNRSGSNQIWVMDADGSNPVNLTMSGNMAQYPSWSPDGSKVAFIRSNWPMSQVKVINADGTGEKVLVDFASISNETAWSPDGKWIAFASTMGGGQHKIHRVSTDGGGIVKLTNGEGGDRAPCFQTKSTISFAEPAYSVDEGAGTATFTLKRTGATNGRVSAKVNITDVTASPADYRSLSPGALDLTYAQIPLGSPYYSSQMALQPDGKLLIGSTPVRRFNTDGSPDTTFQPASLNFGAMAVAPQPDGKIVISGAFTTVNNIRKNRIARLNADGSLDETFDAGAGLNDFATSIIVQPDGKIVIGGYFNSVNSVQRFHIARLNADGSLDTTYQQPLFISTVYAMALQPDGKIVAATGSGTIRLNSDGSSDDSFIRSNDSHTTVAVALQPDGKILIGGSFEQLQGTPVYHIARLNADGTLDRSFDTGTGPSSYVQAVALQPDGKVIIAGSFNSFNGTATSAAVARLNANGSLDPSFKASQELPGNSPVQLLLIQPDGKVLVGGSMTMLGSNFNRRSYARLENDLFVTWADGDAADKTITLPITEDLLDEPDETLTLTLNPLSGNTVAGANAATTLTILDNDVPPAFTSALPPSFVTQGREYSHTFTATGSPKPIFNVTAGALPVGLFLMPFTGQLSGTPLVGGIYNVTVTASNGVSPSASQTFTIRVNRVPAANQNNYSLAEDSSLTIAAPGFLANDTDADGDSLTAELITTTTKGTLTFNGDGSFAYTPNANFNGTDGFTYRVTDGNDYSQNATVFFNVTAVNDAPVNSVPGAQVIVENNPLIFSTARGNLLSVSDFDANANPIRVAFTATGGTLTLSRTAGLTFFLGDGTADAAMTFNGTPLNINLALNGMSFMPATGFSGMASLQMSTSDLGNTGSGGVLTDVDVVNISVLEGGDFRFAAPTYSADEKAGTITITVARTGGSAGTAAVNYSTSNGSATSGADYAPASGVLNFGDGETSKTFSITIINDAAAEADETVNLTLGGAGGSSASAVLTILDDDTSTLQFSAPGYQVNEGDGRVSITVTRSGDTSGAASADYRTTDTDTFTVGCADATNNQGGAYARCDFATTVGRLDFAAGESQKTLIVPVVNDGHNEITETFQVMLSNLSGVQQGAATTATVSIQDNDQAGAPNPVTTSPEFFVRQQYLDFLSREPDEGGLNAWLGVLNNCANIFTGANVPSGCDRIFVSGEGFFRSVEFQLKGFYVFRFYKVGFNRLPEYPEIVTDMSFVAGRTAEEVFARKAQLATLITERAEFQTAYGGMTNSQYVAALLGRYSLTQITAPDPTQPDGSAKVTLMSTDLTNKLNANTLTRAQVLRLVADSDEVGAAELNNAFVGMQYYGYLRRKPDDAGFRAWLGVLQAGNVRTMVDGFLNSVEYNLRFGRP
ncbi:MAG TPA: Calx-beta domain-containing protein [Pyrinomonadaceae bacterium]|nr:Calx-beta domain-containing protein [Pyrinomonadaceae bacterium]